MLAPTFFGKLNFELVVAPSGPTYEQTFPGVFEVRDPGPRRRRGATPKYHRRKWSSLKNGPNRDCGCYTDRSRSPEVGSTLFF